MPVLNANLKQETLAAHKQRSYEQLLSSWLSSAGWEVLIPVIDHGKKTDLIAADLNNYYRIQVKSLETADDNVKVENKWKGAKIDYVVYFSRSGNWGYVVPAFEQNHRRLKDPSHIRFIKDNREAFLSAFEQAQ